MIQNPKPCVKKWFPCAFPLPTRLKRPLREKPCYMAAYVLTVVLDVTSATGARRHECATMPGEQIEENREHEAHTGGT